VRLVRKAPKKKRLPLKLSAGGPRKTRIKRIGRGNGRGAEKERKSNLDLGKIR